MNKDYMNKLINDIQEYLREEDMKVKRERHFASEPESVPAGRLRLRRPVYSVLITLFSACALGSITVAILLLGLVGGPRVDSVGTVWLLTAGGCGIFFSVMLVSVWKRLVILVQIERNTRLILDSRHRTNELLERLVRNMN